VLITLHRDEPSSAASYQEFHQQDVLGKLRALDSRIRRRGLESVDPARNPLVGIGMEVGPDGKVQKNGYGVFNLSWQVREHPEWPRMIREEAQALKKAVRQSHGVPMRYVIWAGMGGSAEDKATYLAAGLLKRGPRLYILDSTDPAKLKNILEDLTARSKLPLGQALRSTLVVGMAMGMTSYEPVVNLSKLAELYERYGIDSRSNFLYMTLPGSLLDKFCRKRQYRSVQLQPDGENSTAGRHTAPLTRGSLYPLAWAGQDLEGWMSAAVLTDEEIAQAWRLAAFLNAQAMAGRNKVTLMLPRQWEGAGLWTKQNFEESLGKREDFGLKIVIHEHMKAANYRSPKDPLQDRCFLIVQVKGLTPPDGRKTAVLRRSYPTATLTMNLPQLSRYMQFMHYTVFGVAWLQRMNFVTQPGVELYKKITNRIYEAARKAGGLEQTDAWQSVIEGERRARWGGALTLCWNQLPFPVAGQDAAEIYANIVTHVAGNRLASYAELTFFGDTRYCSKGRKLVKELDRCAEKVFRSILKWPVDLYEGPAMNHSYHEMIIGHGDCFSTVMLSERAEKLNVADYDATYHRAQFLATQMALAERGRPVCALLLKDLEAPTLDVLCKFFRQVAAHLKAKRLV
jgi:glucose-6-phosphate isomerase